MRGVRRCVYSRLYLSYGLSGWHALLMQRDVYCCTLGCALGMFLVLLPLLLCFAARSRARYSDTPAVRDVHLAVPSGLSHIGRHRATGIGWMDSAQAAASLCAHASQSCWIAVRVETLPPTKRASRCASLTGPTTPAPRTHLHTPTPPPTRARARARTHIHPPTHTPLPKFYTTTTAATTFTTTTTRVERLWLCASAPCAL